MYPALSERLDRHPLVSFLLVSFGWTWTWDALYYSFGWWETIPTTFPRQWGVPLGALVVAWASEVPLRSWLRHLGRWRLHPGLYLLAILVPLGITNLQPAVQAFGGGSLSYAPPAGVPLILLFVLANAVLLGGIEEVGWRGYLQPKLQDRTSVLTAGLIIGVLWWTWHLPLFLGHPNFPLEPMVVLQYTTFIIGASVVFGAFVNATNWCIIPLMLMHATTNLGPLIAHSGSAFDGAALVSLVVGSGTWWLLAIVLIVTFGRSMLPTSMDSPVPYLLAGSTIDPLYGNQE